MMNLSIRQKVHAFAALAVCTALTMFTIGYWGHAISSNVVASMKVDYESLRAQLEVDMRHDALKADLYHALHAASQQDTATVDSLAQSYAQNATEMREWLGKVETRDGGEARAALEAVLPALDRYLAAGTAVFATLRQGETPAAAALNQYNGDYDTLEVGLGRLSDAIQAYAASEAGEATATSLKFLVAGLAVSVVIAIAFGLLLAKSVCGRLDVVGQRMNAIAHGTTDLTVQLDEQGGDELAGMAVNFNLFVQKIAKAVREVIEYSNLLARDCENIAAVTARQRNDVDRQQQELTQVASAMEEMTASSQEVARHTSTASEQVQQSNRTVQAGTASLDIVAGRIRSLADSVEHSTSVITRVQQDCVSIGSVLEVIRGIADQTNLLALNAAIEAARAGEQGRGFAVVADEVRTLATRTQESTREIQQTIERLQSGATEAVNVMNSSRSSASTSVQELQGTVTTLHTINGLVDSLTNMNLQIATAAEEQSSVAGEINRSVNAINALSNEAATGAAKVDEAVRDLATLAENLRGLTATFRVA